MFKWKASILPSVLLLQPLGGKFEVLAAFLTFLKHWARTFMSLDLSFHFLSYKDDTRGYTVSPAPVSGSW